MNGVDARHESVIICPGLETPRDMPHQLLGNVEAQAGGNLLQVVHGEQHESGAFAGTQLLQAYIQPLFGKHAVGQSGSRVVPRHMQQARLAISDAALHAVEYLRQMRELPAT
jgi:hypothetical protein